MMFHSKCAADIYSVQMSALTLLSNTNSEERLLKSYTPVNSSLLQTSLLDTETHSGVNLQIFIVRLPASFHNDCKLPVGDFLYCNFQSFNEKQKFSGNSSFY